MKHTDLIVKIAVVLGALIITALILILCPSCSKQIKRDFVVAKERYVPVNYIAILVQNQSVVEPVGVPV